MKVMENIIYELLAWFTRYRAIAAEHHGFLPDASIFTNLADALYDFRQTINSGELVDVIHIDLLKAFDKICQRILS